MPPPTTSESFTDHYGTHVVVRLQEGHEHVQLLMRFEDNSEPFSYGFTQADFALFATKVRQLDATLAADGV